MRNYRELMKEYLKEPDVDGSNIGYGKWCALNPEQRIMIRRLLDEMDSADVFIKNSYLRNEKTLNMWKDNAEYYKNRSNTLQELLVSTLKKYNHLVDLYDQALEDYDEQLRINEEHRKLNGELREKNEQLRETVQEALGIANERVNHYHHINNKEVLEDWEEIFDILLKQKV